MKKVDLELSLKENHEYEFEFGGKAFQSRQKKKKNTVFCDIEDI